MRVLKFVKFKYVAFLIVSGFIQIFGSVLILVLVELGLLEPKISSLLDYRVLAEVTFLIGVILTIVVCYYPKSMLLRIMKSIVVIVASFPFLFRVYNKFDQSYYDESFSAALWAVLLVISGILLLVQEMKTESPTEEELTTSQTYEVDLGRYILEEIIVVGNLLIPGLIHLVSAGQITAFGNFLAESSLIVGFVASIGGVAFLGLFLIGRRSTKNNQKFLSALLKLVTLISLGYLIYHYINIGAYVMSLIYLFTFIRVLLSKVMEKIQFKLNG